MGKRSREALGETFPEGKSKKRKHEGKDGKEKKKRLRELKKDVVGLPEEEENVQADAPADAAENGEAEVLSKKAEKKKRRKMKEAQEDEAKDGSKGDEAGAEQAQAEAPEGDSKNEEAEQGVDEEEEAASGKKPRFIVFVGNLPYSATAKSIEAHFAPLHPTSVRCLNKRDDPTKCRGCAFVEFSSSKSIRTCLDKWHHSTFEDGVSKARKINVELTAGGGGKKSNRMDKIKEKNAKLNAKRTRRIEEEKKNKKKEGGKAEPEAEVEENGGMHPSRRARMK